MDQRFTFASVIVLDWGILNPLSSFVSISDFVSIFDSTVDQDKN